MALMRRTIFMKRVVMNDILEELEFSESEKRLFKNIRLNIKLLQIQDQESKIKLSIKKLIEEEFNK